MLVAVFSTGVQHVTLVVSMGFLPGKTLSGVLVVHIVCIAAIDGSIFTLLTMDIM